MCYWPVQKKMNDTFKDLRRSTFLTFMGINLFFVAGNIINFLIFFDILHTDDPENRYDIHTPSIPDSNVDILLVIMLVAAFFYMKSFYLNNMATDIEDDLRGMEKHNQGSVRRINEYVSWSCKIVYMSVVGSGLYLFSKYVLSTGILPMVLEAVFGVNTNGGLTFVFSVLNDLIIVCSPIFIVYAYNKYMSTERSVAFALYLFFIIRNLFATNVLGLVTSCDLHAGAPFLDIMSPLIIGYSIFCFRANYQAIVHKEQELLKNSVIS